MANYKFIGGDGKTYGPYSLEQLIDFKNQQRLDGETKVQKDAGEFLPANSFPEITGQITIPPQQQIGSVPQGVVQHYPQQPLHPNVKPGKVQAIAIMTLVGGIFAILASLAWATYVIIFGMISFGLLCVFIVFPIYQLTAGIILTVRGAQMLGKNPQAAYSSAKSSAILQIICIICCDVFNLVMGIVSLVNQGDPQVRTYMQLHAK